MRGGVNPMWHQFFSTSSSPHPLCFLPALVSHPITRSKLWAEAEVLSKCHILEMSLKTLLRKRGDGRHWSHRVSLRVIYLQGNLITHCIFSHQCKWCVTGTPFQNGCHVWGENGVFPFKILANVLYIHSALYIYSTAAFRTHARHDDGVWWDMVAYRDGQKGVMGSCSKRCRVKITENTLCTQHDGRSGR